MTGNVRWKMGHATYYGERTLFGDFLKGNALGMFNPLRNQTFNHSVPDFVRVCQQWEICAIKGYPTRNNQTHSMVILLLNLVMVFCRCDALLTSKGGSFLLPNNTAKSVVFRFSHRVPLCSTLEYSRLQKPASCFYRIIKMKLLSQLNPLKRG